MLFTQDKKLLESYGFRFKGDHQHRIAGLYAIGWEVQTEATYDWHGLKRRENDIVIFQYTLRGLGEIEIKGERYSLKEGDAFFVQVPSNHRYYLPENSDEWEFIYLTLIGKEALQAQKDIEQQIGNVLHMNIYSPAISLIFDTLKGISEGRYHDSYATSAIGYRFLMELYRYINHLNDDQELPNAIHRAILFMQKNYSDPLTLDDIVNVSKLSKYHFSRLFHRYTQLTPIQYLKKVRMNRALELLKHDHLTIEEIARLVGYANGNYFSKVFRKTFGLPPGEFRKNSTFTSVDHMIVDS